MSNPAPKPERHAWKQEWASRLFDAGFVARHVAPMVGALGSAVPPDSVLGEVIRDKTSKRMTLRYTFAPELIAYGKVYSDAELGREILRVMQCLWNGGFSAGSALRIPQPLGMAASGTLLLMRGAAGVPLSEILEHGSETEAVNGARLAAQWLTRFQAARVPGLRAESPCEAIEILKLSDAIAKACAENPAEASTLNGMLHNLREVAPTANWNVAPVPMHGQFRAAHVFISAEAVTVIDVEKISLSDPAKDVSRFVHVLKKVCAETGGDVDRVNRVAQEFLVEYGGRAPKNMANYAYFRALLAMKAYAKMLKNRKVSDAERRRFCGLYSREFQAAIERRSPTGIAA